MAPKKSNQNWPDFQIVSIIDFAGSYTSVCHSRGILKAACGYFIWSQDCDIASPELLEYLCSDVVFFFIYTTSVTNLHVKLLFNRYSGFIRFTFSALGGPTLSSAWYTSAASQIVKTVALTWQVIDWSGGQGLKCTPIPPSALVSILTIKRWNSISHALPPPAWMPAKCH